MCYVIILEKVVLIVQVSYNEALEKVVSDGSPPPESLPRSSGGLGVGFG